MTNTREMIVVGKLGSAYGIRGWLKVTAFTDEQEGIFAYSPWVIDIQGTKREIKVLEWRRHGSGVVCRLDGVDDRNDAERLTNAEISIGTEQLQTLPEDEFYWRDLVGCEVVNTQGYNMGAVSGLLETGSNDVLEVKAKSNDAFGKRERLIPFVTGQFVLEVDLAGKQIKVDWDPSF
ncbi:ribosome maturation factor RimM [uncultured Ferrimonas sp.]|uniref:ribosome maturation factor RimM n=1 Tax=uncultured Ferrimonas sp. TaxID=432640 RepID=UPI0026303942|nr:ribosome maturation factor RimM [uncultured Ferrimonas sp.]